MLDNYDRMLLGTNAKRIHIPLGDKFVWRDVADQLRGLATMLDHYSRLPVTPDLDERTMHVVVMSQIDSVNRIISDAADRAGLVITDGRKKAPRKAERGEHDTGTEKTDRRWEPQAVEFQRLKR